MAKKIEWELIENATGKVTHARAPTAGGWLFTEWDPVASVPVRATIFIPDPDKKWSLPEGGTVITPPVVVTPPVVTPPVVVPPVNAGPKMYRPSVNTGTGFFVYNGKLYDPNGYEFIMRGMNTTLAWGWKEHNSEAVVSKSGIAKTGANTVRLVFSSTVGHMTVGEKDAMIAAAIANGMVPVLGLWDATGKEAATDLQAVFNYWLTNEHVLLLKKYEKHIILNPANEWGGYADGLFVAQYNAGIAKLRSAGVNCTIMVDASGAYGQNPRSILNAGDSILNADPQKNVMFSLHLYAYHRSPDKLTGVGSWNDAGLGTPWDTIAEVKKIVAKKLPLVIGEIGFGGPQVPYNPKIMMQELKKLGIGWLVWSWNQNSDSNLDMFKVNSDWLYSNDGVLSPGGVLFITDPEVGLKATAARSTHFWLT
jgi:mannan endo-1,4-beta-mannosidase